MSDYIKQSSKTYRQLFALKDTPFDALDTDLHRNRARQINYREFYHQLRAEEKAAKGWGAYMQRSIDHIGLSFRYPETKMHLPYKMALVGLGAYMLPQGIYNAVNGAMEETPQTAGSTGGANVTRVCVGGFEGAVGAALLYFGLTKCGHLGKIAQELIRRGEGFAR